MNALASYRLRIRRFKPGAIDPPRFQTYTVDSVDGAPHTVLDALELIRNTRDAGLMFRHSCHHSSCGTCALTVNGRPRLACTTPLAEFEDGRITLEPLEGFDCIGDLVVDMEGFFNRLDPEWSYGVTEQVEPEATQDARRAAWHRLEDCIECGCCVSACPEAHRDTPFLGPAVLAAVHRQYLKFPDQRDELLAIAGGDGGERWCRRALACSRVCPTKVYPARHIMELRKLVEEAES